MRAQAASQACLTDYERITIEAGKMRDVQACLTSVPPRSPTGHSVTPHQRHPHAASPCEHAVVRVNFYASPVQPPRYLDLRRMRVFDITNRETPVGSKRDRVDQHPIRAASNVPANQPNRKDRWYRDPSSVDQMRAVKQHHCTNGAKRHCDDGRDHPPPAPDRYADLCAVGNIQNPVQ